LNLYSGDIARLDFIRKWSRSENCIWNWFKYDYNFFESIIWFSTK